MNERAEIKKISKSFKFHFFYACIGLLFIAIVFRLFFLQIYMGENMKSFSDLNRFKKQIEIAPRGLILDRKGEILVGNKKQSQLVLYLNPQKEVEEEGLKKAASIIGVPPEDLKKKIKRSQKRNGPFHPVILKTHLLIKEIHKIKQMGWDYEEFQVVELDERVYPLKENGSQIFGFIGPISNEEVKNLRGQNKNSSLVDVIGRDGLEKSKDSFLRGENGFSLIEVNARNLLSQARFFYPSELLKQDPRPGKNLKLTLDKHLQQASLQAMKRKDLLGEREGAVIVMKTNGEILSLVSEPGFDPSLMVSRIGEEKWSEISKKGNKFFLNKALVEPLSPGSTFKPFIALMALQENVITKNTLIPSPKTVFFGNQRFRDLKDRGNLNVISAIEQSANGFFYNLARDLKLEQIQKYAPLFGFGEKTDLELLREEKGVFPTPKWQKESRLNRWREGDTVNLFIGQGYLLSTLMQLAVAYNVIATEGLLVKPFIIKKPSEEIEIVDSLTDKIDRAHFQTVKEALLEVVEGDKGTARWSRLREPSFAGKTGTAQVVSLSKNQYRNCKQMRKKLRHHGFFIAYAPSHNPEIVVAVLAENTCSGSSGAAPVARDIIQAWHKARKNKG